MQNISPLLLEKIEQQQNQTQNINAKQPKVDLNIKPDVVEIDSKVSKKTENMLQLDLLR